MSEFSAPVTKAFVINPSDTVDSTTEIRARAVYVGTTGNLIVVFSDDPTNTQVTLSSVPVGWHPMSVKYVIATGTTASNLVGGN